MAEKKRDYISMIGRLSPDSRKVYLQQALAGFKDEHGEPLRDARGQPVPGLERRYMELLQDYRINVDLANEYEACYKEVEDDPDLLPEGLIGPKEQARRSWKSIALATGQLMAQLSAVYDEIDRIKSELDKLDPR